VSASTTDNEYSGFTNQGGIENTRHNLSQSTLANNRALGGADAMKMYRNDYGAVCVYCHTPHGANLSGAAAGGAPLWNRTVNISGYTTYSGTVQGTVTQPGAASITCLSCHDGTIAVDSIINMPGSGRRWGTNLTSHDESFLDKWAEWAGPDESASGNHLMVGNELGEGGAVGCQGCHSPDSSLGEDIMDFRLVAIGTDLTNDHPVGIEYGKTWDMNTMDGSRTGVEWFDSTANGRPDKDEIRAYNGKVECASCHDPHGVPEAGPGSQFIPTFLRKSNEGSALCTVCHAK
jgi:mono/diheme cytochrome c family protein